MSDWEIYEDMRFRSALAYRPLITLNTEVIKCLIEQHAKRGSEAREVYLHAFLNNLSGACVIFEIFLTFRVGLELECKTETYNFEYFLNNIIYF
jgi:hypothetical protein